MAVVLADSEAAAIGAVGERGDFAAVGVVQGGGELAPVAVAQTNTSQPTVMAASTGRPGWTPGPGGRRARAG